MWHETARRTTKIRPHSNNYTLQCADFFTYNAPSGHISTGGFNSLIASTLEATSIHVRYFTRTTMASAVYRCQTYLQLRHVLGVILVEIMIQH